MAHFPEKLAHLFRKSNCGSFFDFSIFSSGDTADHLKHHNVDLLTSPVQIRHLQSKKEAMKEKKSIVPSHEKEEEEEKRKRKKHREKKSSSDRRHHRKGRCRRNNHRHRRSAAAAAAAAAASSSRSSTERYYEQDHTDSSSDGEGKMALCSKVKVISAHGENPFSPPPFHSTLAGEPQFCCFTTRAAVIVFAALSCLLHAVRFLFLLSHDFAQYAQDMEDGGVPGMHEADVALELLAVLPAMAAGCAGHFRRARPLLAAAACNIAAFAVLTYLHLKGALVMAELREGGSHGRPPLFLGEEEARNWQTSSIANRAIFTAMDVCTYGLLASASLSYANFLRKHGKELRKQHERKELEYPASESD